MIRSWGRFYMAPGQEGNESIRGTVRRSLWVGCTQKAISNETDEAGGGQIRWARQANGRCVYSRLWKTIEDRCDLPYVCKSSFFRDFPGGAVARTQQSQCRKPGFNPWPRN